MPASLSSPEAASERKNAPFPIREERDKASVAYHLSALGPPMMEERKSPSTSLGGSADPKWSIAQDRMPRGSDPSEGRASRVGSGARKEGETSMAASIRKKDYESPIFILYHLIIAKSMTHPPRFLYNAAHSARIVPFSQPRAAVCRPPYGPLAPHPDYYGRSVYYVYLLKSKKDESLYIGYTNDLKRRFDEHNDKKSRSTKHKAPFELVYYEAYQSSSDARFREDQLKRHAQGLSALKRRLRNSLGEGPLA